MEADDCKGSSGAGKWVGLVPVGPLEFICLYSGIVTFGVSVTSRVGAILGSDVVNSGAFSAMVGITVWTAASSLLDSRDWVPSFIIVTPNRAQGELQVG